MNLTPEKTEAIAKSEFADGNKITFTVCRDGKKLFLYAQRDEYGVMIPVFESLILAIDETQGINKMKAIAPEVLSVTQARLVGSIMNTLKGTLDVPEDEGLFVKNGGEA